MTNKRTAFKKDIISVTGTCGKTTTTGMIYSVLKQSFKLQKPHPDRNGRAGVCNQINNYLKQTDDMWLLEVGIDEKGGMKRILSIVKPTLKILINVDNDHSEHFKSIEEYQKEKLSFLADPTDTIIINNDDKLIYDYVEQNIPADEQVIPKMKIIRCGESSACDIELLEYHINADNTSSSARYKTPQGELICALPFIGQHFALNAAFAIACGIHYGLSLDQIRVGLSSHRLHYDRGAAIKFRKGVLFNNTYNFKPRSVLHNLEAFASINAENKWIIIYGYFCKIRGGEELYEEVLQKAFEITDNVIVYNPYRKDSPVQKPGYKGKFIIVTTKDKLLTIITSQICPINKQLVYIYMHMFSDAEIFHPVKNALKIILN